MKKLKNLKGFIFFVIGLFWLPTNAKIIDNNLANKLTSQNRPAITNLNSVQSAFDNSANTINITTCLYSKRRICKIRIRERMSTIIELPDNDKINTWALGDKQNFSFKPIDKLQQRAILRMVIPGSDTNLSIIGQSGFIYTFYVRADSSNSKYLPSFVVRIKLNKQDKKLLELKKEYQKIVKNKPIIIQPDIVKIPTLTTAKDYLSKKKPVDVQDIFFSFKQISGDKSLMPFKIFDDGIWTYFQYGKDDMLSVQDLPTIYKVKDGFDTPVNSRIEKGSLVIEAISDKWTIRSGQSHACVHKQLSLIWQK